MSGSIFGKMFRISTFGESHGEALGVVVDGCPSNIPIALEDIMKNMDRRKPGNAKIGTTRSESDKVEILSGIFEGKTTGTPIALLIRNTDHRSSDYGKIKEVYRPSHADYTFDQKYGIRDYRGGGRSSGRETSARVAAGSIAKRFLQELGITVTAYTRSIGSVSISDDAFSFEEISQNPVSMPNNLVAEKAVQLIAQARLAKDSIGGTVDSISDDAFSFEEISQNPVSMPNNLVAEKAVQLIAQARLAKDSIGGTVECVITGVKPGIGETVFDKLDANLAYAIMGIGGVKAFEVGEGVKASTMYGSEYNDGFYMNNGKVAKTSNHSGGILGGMSDGSDIFIKAHFKPTPSIAQAQKTGFYMNNGKVAKTSNHSGGILGGMSDGSDIFIKAHFKPTPSIAQAQKTITTSLEDTTIEIAGRHDPVIVPRAVVVVESMVALTLADLILCHLGANIAQIKKLY